MYNVIVDVMIIRRQRHIIPYYVERGDFAEVRAIQNALLAAYEQKT